MRALTVAARLLIAVALILVVGNTVAGAADAGRRVALVIGNAAYGGVALANPVNDARDMSRMLRQAGFEVVERIEESLDVVLPKEVSQEPRLSPGH